MCRIGRIASVIGPTVQAPGLTVHWTREVLHTFRANLEADAAWSAAFVRSRGGGVVTTRPSGARHAAVEDSAASGVEGNARLTGLNGVLLVVLLAVEGATILRIRQLISVHVYVGCCSSARYC